MKALSTKKVYTLTIEATYEELENLLFSLRDYNGYGVVEDLEAIIVDTIGEPKPDDGEEQ